MGLRKRLLGKRLKGVKQTSPGLPIRTTYDIAIFPTPERTSENFQKLLKGTLPLVKANVRLTGLDSPADGLEEELSMTIMIWDTGAHRTIICEDCFLSHSANI